MLNVFICEDIDAHRNEIRGIVEKCIIVENLDMEVKIGTDNPHAICEYVMTTKSSGLYFLDVDLKCDIDGITLAERIRDYDPRGFIVFITAHPEALHITFEHKVEAMDFIIKDPFIDLKSRIKDCILNAHKKYTLKISALQRNFSFKLFDKIITIECEKILCFEASTQREHKIVIHSFDGRFEFTGFLKDIEARLDDKFYRCYKSYIVNLQNIKNIHITGKMITLMNGDQIPVSARYLQALKKKVLQD